jgi:hypothetical protein
MVFFFLVRQKRPPTGIRNLSTKVLHKFQQMGLTGFPQQTHPGLIRGSPSLENIALFAAANNIGPRHLTTSTLWNHVIQRQLLGQEYRATVLTGVTIARHEIDTI